MHFTSASRAPLHAHALRMAGYRGASSPCSESVMLDGLGKLGQIGAAQIELLPFQLHDRLFLSLGDLITPTYGEAHIATAGGAALQQPPTQLLMVKSNS